MEFTGFEDAVVRKIIDRTPQYKEKLARQFDAARVTSREYTGHGFFTNFEVADKAAALGNGVRLALGDVVAEVEGIEHGVGFVLFVEDGLMTCLEGYVFGKETFPEKIERFHISDTRVAFHTEGDEMEV